VAEPDEVDRFFDELGRQGYDALLHRMDAVGRVELRDGTQTAQWLVAVRGGNITVTQGGDSGADADWVLRAERPAFARVLNGDIGPLAALVRGTIGLQMVDPAQTFGLITRLFARPLVSDQERNQDRPVDRLTSASTRGAVR
jgi:hypothetical protein